MLEYYLPNECNIIFGLQWMKLIPSVISFVKYGRNFTMEFQKIGKFEDSSLGMGGLNA
jgi:hypothetical protein